MSSKAVSVHDPHTYADPTQVISNGFYNVLQRFDTLQLMQFPIHNCMY